MTLRDQVELFGASLAGDAEAEWPRLLVLDALGAGLAGRAHPAPAALRRLAPAPPPLSSGDAQLIGGGRCDAVTAGAANAAAVHALDFDDTHRPSLVHVSSVLVPVCLALAEREDLDLGRFLRAYALGLRFTAFAQRIGPMLNAAGYHTTAVLGAVVAAAAGAWVLDEDPRRAAVAAELAATSAMGLTASFGTDAKPIQVGFAAANAARAALLSGSDVTVPRGFTGPDGLVARLLGADAPHLLRWGDRCDDGAVGVVPKPYPCCYLIHGAVRCALDLRERIAGGDRIETARVTIGPLAADLALKAPVPGDAQTAKFSTAYCVAHVLATGHLGVSDFDDPLGPGDAETRRILGGLTTEIDPSLGPVAATVTVRLRSGPEHEASFDPAAATAMSRDDLVGKFRSNASRTITAGRAERLEQDLLTRDPAFSVRALAEHLAAG
ncbi:MmgE/PrpD family protein [Actinomadura roseirufa]|uniref:MmgE/PrpD family protein n=1 Tax=Actinomadura roseirufa TaxID=2094049 RepID=UPI001041131E|nr:MmgE/PrpD family protein [Actinomadura roseirufa]